jgi:hypothetical protein
LPNLEALRLCRNGTTSAPAFRLSR